MKIDPKRIPAEGLILTQEFSPGELDLETDIIRFRSAVNVRAEVTRISNTLCVHLAIAAAQETCCSRCLEDFQSDYKKNLDLHFPVDASVSMIDLDPETREEIILDYPVKPLCQPDCRGLCAQCGENLNEAPGRIGSAGVHYYEGGCSCGTTEKKAF